MSPHTPDLASGAPTRSVVPDAVVASAVICAGLATIVIASTVTVPLSSNVVGPRAFPYAVGVVLSLAGVAVLVDTLRGRLGAPDAGEDVDTDAPTDWSTLLRIFLSFAAHIAVVDLVGWALAGALLFTLIAWSLGANIVRAAVAGLILGFVVQALFVSALGVTLPAGPFAGVSLLNG